MKIYDYSASEFHERLFSILKKKKDGEDFGSTREIAPYWSVELGVSDSSVRDSWDRGSYPGADKIVILCSKVDVSVRWLLTGEGSKHLKPEPESGDSMKLTPEEFNRILRIAENNSSMAIGCQKEIQDLRDEIKNLTSAIHQLKIQCSATQDGLGKVESLQIEAVENQASK